MFRAQDKSAFGDGYYQIDTSGKEGGSKPRLSYDAVVRCLLSIMHTVCLFECLNDLPPATH